MLQASRNYSFDIIYNQRVFIFHLIVSGDCGRGFVRIEDVCVNVSIAEAADGGLIPKTDLTQAECQKVCPTCTPLITKSASFFFQLRVRQISTVNVKRYYHLFQFNITYFDKRYRLVKEKCCIHTGLFRKYSFGSNDTG